MTLPKRISAYGIERQVLDKALMLGKIEYELPSVSSANHFRHRANYLRKLLAEGGEVKFECLSLALDHGSAIVRIEVKELRGVLRTPEGETIPLGEPLLVELSDDVLQAMRDLDLEDE